MIKLYRLIIASAFVALIPCGLNAQSRFEISAGISTPGMHVCDKRGLGIGEPVDFYDKYHDVTLTDMEKESYRSSYYPGYSLQAAYKLADHGFTKRLSVVAYAGLTTVGFEKIDYFTNTPLYSEKVLNLDLLVGVRYHIMSKEHFMMYTQAMVGGRINDNSLYWEYNDIISDNPAPFQITYLGFRFKSKNGICFLTELGEGLDYSLFGMILIPGVRLSLGYTF